MKNQLFCQDNTYQAHPQYSIISLGRITFASKYSIISLGRITFASIM